MTDPLDSLALPDGPIQPDETFAATLRRRVANIERTIDRARSAPVPTQTFIPYLCVTDSRAAFEFYAEIFGATQEEMFEMDDGRVGHVTMNVGGAHMYMADEFPEIGVVAPTSLDGNALSIVVNVADADEIYEAALAAGATGERPPANQHGARSGWFRDPWGHRWSPTSPAKPDLD